EAAEPAFQRGLHHAQPLAMPFEHALLELAYGQFLRRSGKRRAAAARLGQRKTASSRSAPGPASSAAIGELVASGLAPVKRQGRNWQRLTAQALCVDQL